MLQSKPSVFVERNNIKAFLVLLRDWIAIFLIAGFSIWTNNIFVYLVSVWAIGIFQFTIGEVLLHEAAHYNLFQKKSWHEKLEFLYSFPVLTTLFSYKKHHFPHHKYLASDKDYINDYYEMLGLYKPDNNLFFMVYIRLAIGFALYHFVVNVCFRLKDIDWRPFKSGFKLLIFWLIVFLSFYFSGNIKILLLYWFVPLVWSFSCYSCWSEVEEHFNTVSGTRTNVDFLTNLLVHNCKYHYVHHHYPSIPWYNLPEAHKALCADNPDISCGFLDTYRQMTNNAISQNI